MVERDTREIIRKIPLEECKYECSNIIEKTYAWHAPNGKIFRLSGDFEITYNGRTSPENENPLWIEYSASVVKSDHKSEYDEFLKKASGDEEKALSMLVDSLDIDGVFEAPEFFYGKWLEIEMWRNKTLLYLFDDMEAFIDNPSLWTEIDNKYLFATENDPRCFSVEWSQTYAKGLGENYNIELIDYKEKKSELFIPKVRGNGKKLIVPLRCEESFTSDQWSEEFELSDIQRTAFLREHRNNGMPFKDDPLYYAYLPQRRGSAKFFVGDDNELKCRIVKLEDK